MGIYDFFSEMLSFSEVQAEAPQEEKVSFYLMSPRTWKHCH
jgi:hypothetical protein